MHLYCAERWANGVAVLTPKAAPQALLALHAALCDGFEGLNLATETRRWRPHLTLARYAGDSAAPAQTAPVYWRVRGCALVESHAVTSTASYCGTTGKAWRELMARAGAGVRRKRVFGDAYDNPSLDILWCEGEGEGE